MPYLTVQEIETIAGRIVRAYHRYCAQQNQKVTRIDPEIVTSNVLGLQIAYHKLSRFGYVLGLTERNDLNNPYSLIDICCDD